MPRLVTPGGDDPDGVGDTPVRVSGLLVGLEPRP